jgi:hypothetical protein
MVPFSAFRLGENNPKYSNIMIDYDSKRRRGSRGRERRRPSDNLYYSDDERRSRTRSRGRDLINRLGSQLSSRSRSSRRRNRSDSRDRYHQPGEHIPKQVL